MTTTFITRLVIKLIYVVKYTKGVTNKSRRSNPRPQKGVLPMEYLVIFAVILVLIAYILPTDSDKSNSKKD